VFPMSFKSALYLVYFSVEPEGADKRPDLFVYEASFVKFLPELSIKDIESRCKKTWDGALALAVVARPLG
jgi:hypothetical protein